MFQSGLLVLTSPLRVLSRIIPGLLVQCEKLVEASLYIQLNPNQSHDCIFPTLLPFTRDIQQFIPKIYQSAYTYCRHLDCYVLVGNIGNVDSYRPPHYRLSFDVLLLEQESMLTKDTTKLLETTREMFDLQKLPSVEMLELVKSPDIHHGNCSHDESSPSNIVRSYKKCVLGGTFDRFHVGHKIMLTESCLRCDDTIVVGVSKVSHNSDKVLAELIEPLATRMSGVTRVINTIKPQLATDVVPLIGIFGPSTVYSDLDCIIVSKETERGGDLVNAERQRKGLSQLEQVCIDLVCDDGPDEAKVSSSSHRRSLLGELLREPIEKQLASRPYRIGLTGGIGSGKSSVAARLEKLGAGIIDCDKLGHCVYRSGSNCFSQVVSEFGAEIVGSDGEIDRKKLGPLVFSDKAKLDALNKIVWPEILKLADREQQRLHADGVSVVVYDAAVLLEAGWDDGVHEVWVCVIPEGEAVERVKRRNCLSEQAATQRIRSQMSSDARVERANVVISTLWDYSCTQAQVEKAWRLLQDRLPSVNTTS